MTQPFFARIGRASWDSGLARSQIVLSTGSYQDKRHLTVYSGEPFYNVLVANDPYILKDFHPQGRDLYPVWKLELDEHHKITGWAMMPLSDTERIQQDNQRNFDALYELGRQYKLPFDTVESIARDCQREVKENDWLPEARERIARRYASDQSEKLLNWIRFHRRENDYWWWVDEPPYPTAEFTAKLEKSRALMHAYPVKR